MANSITKQVVQEGVRNFIVNISGILDTSDLPLTTIITPADCTYYIPKNFRLDCVDFTISDQLTLQLFWQGTPDSLIAALAGRDESNYTGGLQNNAYAPTGGINLLTKGYVSGVQTFNLIFSLVKINVDNRI